MQNYILITENSVTYNNIVSRLYSSFECHQVMKDRLLIKDRNNHAFLDYDDDMRNDYEDENIRNSDCHFYGLIYHSQEFAKSILRQLADLPIRVDDDERTILEIKSFLGSEANLFDK